VSSSFEKVAVGLGKERNEKIGCEYLCVSQVEVPLRPQAFEMRPCTLQLDERNLSDILSYSLCPVTTQLMIPANLSCLKFNIDQNRPTVDGAMNSSQRYSPVQLLMYDSISVFICTSLNTFRNHYPLCKKSYIQ
jgi:hypothetical protein